MPNPSIPTTVTLITLLSSITAFGIYYLVLELTKKTINSAISIVSTNDSSSRLNVPGTPLQLKTSSVYSNSITISWKTPDINASQGTAASYKVLYQVLGASDWIEHEKTENLFSEVDFLIPNIIYQFQVYSISTAGYSINAANLQVQTASNWLQTNGFAPGIPTQATVGIITTDTIPITWVAPLVVNGSSGIPVQYVISVQISNNTGLNGNGWIQKGATFNTNFNISGLVSGASYNIQIYAINNYGDGLPNQTLVNQIVSQNSNSGSFSAPSEVLSLSASSNSSNTADIRWSIPSSLGGDPIVEYVISYRLSGSNSAWVGYTETTNTSITIGSLVNNSQYDFRVVAINSFGQSPVSTVPSITINNGIGVAIPPSQVNPSSIFITGNTQTGFTLNWGSASNTYEYTIQYQTSEKNNQWFSFQGNNTIGNSLSLSTVNQSWLTSSTLFNFGITSINNVGSSQPSIISNVQLLASPTSQQSLVVSPPTNLFSVANPGGTSFTLSWSQPLGATSTWQYKVYSTISNGTTSNQGALLNQGITSSFGLVVNVGISPYTQYNFAVSSINDSGVESTTYCWLYNQQSTVASGNTQTPIPSIIIANAPQPVSMFKGVATSNSITLSWNPSTTSDVVQYVVQYQTSNTTNGFLTYGSPISRTDPMSITIPANSIGLIYPNVFNFSVTPSNNAGNGSAAIISMGLSPPAPISNSTSAIPITVPTVLALTPQTILPTWNSVPYAISYVIQVKNMTLLSDWESVATVLENQSPGAATFTTIINNLKVWTTYNVRVAAQNQYGIGDFAQTSSSNNIQTLGWPDVVSNLNIVSTTSQSAVVSWTGSNHTVSYKVQYRWFNDLGWTNFVTSNILQPIPQNNPNTINCTITNLMNSGSIYQFRVISVNETGNSMPSFASPNILLNPADVTDLSITSSTQTSISLQWTKAVGASYYTIEQSLSGKGIWSTSIPLVNNPVTGTATISSLLPGVSYDFRIRGHSLVTNNDSINPSNIATTTTQYASPSGLTASVNDTNVTLQWNPPALSVGSTASQPTQYQVSYSTGNGASWTLWNSGSPITGTTCIVGPLLYGINYTFSVTSYSSVLGNLGGTSYVIAGTAPSQVIGLLGSNATINSFILSWTQCFGNISNYTVKTLDITAGASTPVVNLITTQLNGEITNLIPGHIYSITVYATNIYGIDGRPSTTYTYGTLSPIPTIVLTSGVTSTSQIPITIGTSLNATSYTISYQLTPNSITNNMANTTWTNDSQSPYTATLNLGLATSLKSSTNATFTVTSNLCNLSLSGLTAGSNYTIRIQANNTYGNGPYSLPLFTGTIPVTTTTLTVNSFTTTTASISWPVISSALYYRLDYQDLTASGSWQSVDRILNTSYNLSKLISNHNYQLRLYSTNQNGISSLQTGTLPSFTTGIVSSAPLTITTSNVQSTSLQLNWTINNTDRIQATYFIVKYRSLSSGLITYNSNVVATNGIYNYNLNITGLSAGTAYQFQVTSCNSYGIGGFIDTGSSIVGTIPTNPTFDINHTGVSNGSDSVTLTWNPSMFGSFSPSYAVQYRITGSSGALTVATNNEPNTNFTVTGLLGNTSYDFFVYAVIPTMTPVTSSIGMATITMITTPAAITGLFSSLITTNSFTLNWTNVSNVSLYTVLIQNTDMGINSNGVYTTYATVQAPTNTLQVSSGTGNSTNVTIIATGFSLTPGGSYNVILVPSNGSGTGVQSMIQVDLLPSTPILSISSFTDTSIVANWTSLPNVAFYTVSCQQITPSGSTTTYQTSENIWKIVNLSPSYVYQISMTATTFQSKKSITSNLITQGTIPAVVSNLSVSGSPTSSSVNLTWTSLSNVSNYILMYRIDSGSTESGIWNTSSQTISSNSVIVSSANGTPLLSGTTYSFGLISVGSNNSGNSSLGNIISVNMLCGTTTNFQMDPTQIFVDASTSTAITLFDLTWNAINGAIRYKLEGSTNGTTYTDYSSSLNFLTDTTTTIRCTIPMTYGTYYRVSGANASNLTGDLTYVNPNPLVFPPSAPVLTTATSTSNTITINWGLYTTSVATSFNTRYMVSGGSSWIIGPTALSTATNCTISSLNSNQLYVIQVQAFNSTTSLGSNWTQISWGTIPQAVTTLSVDQGSTNANVGWVVPNGSGAVDFQVGMLSGTQSFYNITSSNSYNFQNLDPFNNIYQLYVQPSNPYGTGLPTVISTLRQLTTPTKGYASGSPNNVNNGNNIVVSWNAARDASNNIIPGVLYTLLNAINGSGWTNAGVGLSSTSYTLSNLPAGDYYAFQLQAKTTTQSSPFSWTGTNFYAFSPAPLIVQTNYDTSSVTFDFTVYNTRGTVNLYIDYSTDQSTWIQPSAGSFLTKTILSANSASNTYSYSVGGLSINTRYYFRARIANVFSDSTVSNSPPIYVLPSGINTDSTPSPIPTAPTVTDYNGSTYSSTTAYLSWTAAANASFYNVSVTNTSNGTNITGSPFNYVTGTNLTVNGLSPGTNYTFAVSSVNASKSAVSSSMSTTFTTGILFSNPTITINAANTTTTSVQGTITANGTAKNTNYSSLSFRSVNTGNITGTNTFIQPTAGSNNGSFTMTNLNPSDSYTWTLSGSNSYSSATGTGSSVFTKPRGLTNLTQTYSNGVSNPIVTFNWTKSLDDDGTTNTFQGYGVDITQGVTPIVTGITLIPGTQTSGALTNIFAYNTTYSLVIKSINKYGIPDTLTTNFTTPIAPAPAPSTLTFTGNSVVNTLSWASVPSVTSYVYSYSWGGSNSGNFTTTNTSIPNLSLSSVGNGTLVTFSVYAIGNGIVYQNAPGSVRTASYNVNFPPLAPAPTTLTFTGNNVVNTLSWTSVSNTTSYVYSYAWGSSNSGNLTTTSTSVTNLNLSSVPDGSLVTFSIYAIGNGTTYQNAPGAIRSSAYTVNFPPLPPAPSTLTFTGNATTNTLTWSAITGVSGYVYSYSSTGVSFESSSTTSTTFSNINLLPVGDGASVTFSVYAIGNGTTYQNGKGPLRSANYTINYPVLSNPPTSINFIPADISNASSIAGWLTWISPIGAGDNFHIKITDFTNGNVIFSQEDSVSSSSFDSKGGYKIPNISGYLPSANTANFEIVCFGDGISFSKTLDGPEGSYTYLSPLPSNLPANPSQSGADVTFTWTQSNSKIVNHLSSLTNNSDGSVYLFSPSNPTPIATFQGIPTGNYTLRIIPTFNYNGTIINSSQTFSITYTISNTTYPTQFTSYTAQMDVSGKMIIQWTPTQPYAVAFVFNRPNLGISPKFKTPVSSLWMAQSKPNFVSPTSTIGLPDAPNYDINPGSFNDGVNLLAIVVAGNSPVRDSSGNLVSFEIHRVAAYGLNYNTPSTMLSMSPYNISSWTSGQVGNLLVYNSSVLTKLSINTFYMIATPISNIRTGTTLTITNNTQLLSNSNGERKERPIGNLVLPNDFVKFVSMSIQISGTCSDSSNVALFGISLNQSGVNYCNVTFASVPLNATYNITQKFNGTNFPPDAVANDSISINQFVYYGNWIINTMSVTINYTYMNTNGFPTPCNVSWSPGQVSGQIYSNLGIGHTLNANQNQITLNATNVIPSGAYSIAIYAGNGGVSTGGVIASSRKIGMQRRIFDDNNEESSIILAGATPVRSGNVSGIGNYQLVTDGGGNPLVMIFDNVTVG